MGARIAAHFANAGLPCLLLDIVPKDAAKSKAAFEAGCTLGDADSCKRAK